MVRIGLWVDGGLRVDHGFPGRFMIDFEFFF